MAQRGKTLDERLKSLKGGTTTSGFTGSASTASKQLENYKTRLAAAGQPDATDTRAEWEKFFNLPKNQNIVFDALELLGRPQKALFGGIMAAQKGEDVGAGMARGWGGGEDAADISGGQIIRNTFGLGEETGNIDWTDFGGTVLDMFVDPVDWLLIPATGGASAVAELTAKATTTADTLADALKTASGAAKTLAGYGEDFVSSFLQKAGTKKPEGLFHAINDAMGNKAFLKGLPKELRKQVKEYRDMAAPLIFRMEKAVANPKVLTDAAGKVTGTVIDASKGLSAAEKALLATKSEELFDALYPQMTQAADFIANTRKYKAAKEVADRVSSDIGQLKAYIGYYAQKENRYSISSGLFKAVGKTVSSVAGVADGAFEIALRSLDDANYQAYIRGLTDKMITAGKTAEEIAGAVKAVDIKTPILDSYKGMKKGASDLMTKGAQQIKETLKKGSVNEQLLLNQAEIHKAHIKTVLNTLAESSKMDVDDLASKVGIMVDLGQTPMMRDVSWKGLLEEMSSRSGIMKAPTAYIKYDEAVWKQIQGYVKRAKFDVQDIATVIKSFDGTTVIKFNSKMLKDKKILKQLMSAVDDADKIMLRVSRMLSPELELMVKTLATDETVMTGVRAVEDSVKAMKKTLSDLSKSGKFTISTEALEKWSVENDWRISHKINPDIKLADKTYNGLQYVFGGAGQFVRDRKWNMSALEANYLMRTSLNNFKTAFPDAVAKLTDKQMARIARYADSDMFVYDARDTFEMFSDNSLKSLYKDNVLAEVLVNASIGDYDKAGGVLLRKATDGELVPKDMVAMLHPQKTAVMSKLMKINEIQKSEVIEGVIKMLHEKDVLIDKRLLALINRLDYKSSSSVLAFFDKISGFYKSMKTLSPTFNIVNAVGNGFNMWASGMTMPEVLTYWGKAGKSISELPSLMQLATTKGLEALTEEQKGLYQIGMKFVESGVMDKAALMGGEAITPEQWAALYAYDGLMGGTVDKYGLDLRTFENHIQNVSAHSAMKHKDLSTDEVHMMNKRMTAHEEAKASIDAINKNISPVEYNATERAKKIFDNIKASQGVSKTEIRHTVTEFMDYPDAMLERLSNAKTAEEVLAVFKDPAYKTVIKGNAKDLVDRIAKVAAQEEVIASGAFEMVYKGKGYTDLVELKNALKQDARYAKGFMYKGTVYETLDDLMKDSSFKAAKTVKDGVELSAIEKAAQIKKFAYLTPEYLARAEASSAPSAIYKGVKKGSEAMFDNFVKNTLGDFGVQTVGLNDYAKAVDGLQGTLENADTAVGAMDYAKQNLKDFITFPDTERVEKAETILEIAKNMAPKAALATELRRVSKIKDAKGAELGVEGAINLLTDKGLPMGTNRKTLSNYISNRLGFVDDAPRVMVEIDNVKYDMGSVVDQANEILARHKPKPLDEATVNQRAASIILSTKPLTDASPEAIAKAERDYMISLIDKVRSEGGGTINGATKKILSNADLRSKVGGYQVSIRDLYKGTTFPDSGTAAEIYDANPDGLKALFKKAFANISSEDEYLGMWVDEGKIYVDISTPVKDKMVARVVGDSYGQKAMFDNSKAGKGDPFIYLKDKGEGRTKSLYSEGENAQIEEEIKVKKTAITDEEYSKELDEESKAVIEKLDDETKKDLLEGKYGGVIKFLSKTTGKPADALHKAVQWNVKLNAQMDALSRMAVYLKAVEDPSYLVKLGVETPMDAVRLALFDPKDTSYFEEEWLKRLMPFYTFTKKNILFQAENLARHGEKYHRVYKELDNLWKGTEQDREDIPDYQYNQGNIPIPILDENGNYTYLKLNIPFFDLGEFANDPLKKIMSSLTPALRAPAEIAMNQTFYTGQPIEEFAGQQSTTIPWMSKQWEYALGQTGLDSPLKAIHRMANAGADLMGLNPDKEQPANISAAFNQFIGEPLNISKQGNVDTNKVSAMYADLAAVKQKMQQLKQSGIQLKTVAEIENHNGVLYQLKQKLTKYNKIR